MFLFDINDTTQVNLENIDAITMMKRKSGEYDMTVVICGQTYVVDRSKHKDLIKTIDRVQVGIQLTRQYHSL